MGSRTVGIVTGTWTALHRLVPGEIADPEERRNAALLIGMLLASVGLVPLSGIALAWPDGRVLEDWLLWSSAWGGVAVVGFASLLAARSVRVAAWMTLGAGALVVTSRIVFTGAWASPALPMVALLPCMALLLLGRAAGLAWAALVLALVGWVCFAPPDWSVAMAPAAGWVTTVGWLSNLSLVSVLSVLMFGAAGAERSSACQALVAVVADLDEKNDGLESARQEALRSGEAKSEFLANMSHELRTPLVGVLGIADLLGSTQLRTEQRLYVDTISSSAGHLLAVLNDLLDVSRYEAGRVKVERRVVDLRVLADDLLETFSAAAKARGLDLYASVTGVVDVVHTDPQLLIQIASKLLDNALKFTHEGRVTFAFDVQPTRGEDVLLSMTVADTGIGLPAERLPSMFDRFTQAQQTTRREYGGTGLGLAIVSEVARLLGAELSVSSREGVGSSFRIRLELPRGIRATQPQQGSNRPVAGPLRILAADDDPVARLILSRVLEAQGHRVTVVGDGHEATDLLRGEAFDVLLLDCEMPGMSGFQTAAAAREVTRDSAPVIVALSAHEPGDIEERARAAGMDGVLSKPLDPAALSTLLRDLAARGRPVDV